VIESILTIHSWDNDQGLYVSMILITGASGKTGRALVKALSRVDDIAAMVHREAHVSVLQSLGAEKVIVGDMREKDVINSAMQGISAVYHICPNMSPDEITIGRSIIDAARKNEVGHLVYHSVLHPQIEAMPHHWDKMHMEEMIFESGIPFTILQPAPYMQNLLGSWQTVLEEGVLRIPYSVDSTFSFVDLEDVAEAARIVLIEPDHKNAVYELAGTSPTSHLEIAETFARILERNVQAKKEGISEWQLRAERSSKGTQSKRTTGINGYTVENLIRMFEYYDQFGLVGNPNIMKWLLKREPASVEEFIRRVMEETHGVD
jgi:uncharacterized protein YbjT (DUF2867 family)